MTSDVIYPKGRYLAFAIGREPLGGMRDCIGGFDTFEEAKNAVLSEAMNDLQIVDTATGNLTEGIEEILAIGNAQAALEEEGIIADDSFAAHFLDHPELKRMHAQSAKSGEGGHPKERDDDDDA
jgi:hypothetical protein